ncbi:hypothetical protein ACFXP3_19310, partial [Streptomyces sp. NPDC059096]|uniref:hypothetical protein n=1 Tax=Streptomyces sp. NPDC059096 TaxID=3346727 RepID=UPI003682904B
MPDELAVTSRAAAGPPTARPLGSEGRFPSLLSSAGVRPPAVAENQMTRPTIVEVSISVVDVALTRGVLW